MTTYTYSFSVYVAISFVVFFI